MKKKRCAGICKMDLPLSEFLKNRARHDGLDTRCKSCSRKRRVIVYHQNPEKEKKKSDDYRRSHLEQYRKYSRKRYKTDKWQEYMRKYVAQWLKTDKGKKSNRAKRRRRREKECSASGQCTDIQLQARINYYGGRCWICEKPYEAIDHVKPISKGGAGYPVNLRPICISCNSKKGDTWPFSP